MPTIIHWNDHPGISNPEPSDLLGEDSPEYSKKLIYWTRISNLFSYLPHLRSVKLVFKSGIDGATPYAFSQSFVSRVSALQNLTEVSLTWEVQGYIAFSSLVALFLLPSLRVLYLSDVVCGDEHADDDEDIIPELLEQVKRKSGVKDLTLDFAMVESGPLIALLQLPSALEKFAYSFVSEGIYHRNTSAGRFFDLLY